MFHLTLNQLSCRMDDINSQACCNVSISACCTSKEDLQVWIYICWLPNQRIPTTGNAPYSTGIGIRTSTVRCPYCYCPHFFLLIILFRLATSLRCCTLDEPQNFTYYRYGNFADYRTGNAIMKSWNITGTVIGQVTVPVMLLWCFEELSVR